MENAWLQHAVAFAHFDLIARHFQRHYLSQWTGHGSQTSRTPLSWPPHSPDLTTP
jgi:hypothetical protein